MKTSGIIAEYNPFHLGHKYQINKIKKELNTNIIAIMSGDFVQRGECAILDKYTRAKIAVNNGVDLVIELPFYYSLQSAENFAKGGISILNKLNIVDYLCFGFECEKKEDIIEIAKFQLKYKNEIEELLNFEIKLGKSYAVAYKNACIEINKKYKVLEIQDNFFISNNILSIEYVKNLILSKSQITPFPIKRKGKNYNDEDYNSQDQLSASAIRKAIYENNFEKIILFSAVKEKEYETMIRMLCETIDAKEYILTQIENEQKDYRRGESRKGVLHGAERKRGEWQGVLPWVIVSGRDAQRINSGRKKACLILKKN